MSLVLDAIADHAARLPATTALSWESGAFSYADLETAVHRTADTLADRFGAQCGGRAVALMMENSPAWVIVDLALVRLGWPSLPLPSFFTAAQRDHALGSAGVGLVIEDGAPEAATFRVADRPLRAAVGRRGPMSLPEETAKVTYTSGSTGAPKGVCLSLPQMEAVAQSIVAVVGTKHAGRHLPLLPLAVLLENVAGLYPTLIAGGEYRVMRPASLGLSDPFQPDLGRLIGAIAREQATSLILPPELLRALVHTMAATGVRLPSLNLVAVGGAKTPAQLLTQAAALGLPVFEGYGLSECASVVTLNTPQARRAGSVGQPLPHVQLEIAAGGEIIVGPWPFLGYAGEAPRAGAHQTGDLGRVDADGYLHIDGRRANTIVNSYGRNIAPEWVEAELQAQAEIRQALVFGEGQAELGALIVSADGAADMAIASAIKRANLNLPAYAQVGRWRACPPFDPSTDELTANGRPRRAALMDRYRAFICGQN